MKRLFALICLLHAATLGAMFEQEEAEATPFTFKTKKGYDTSIFSYVDNDDNFVIRVKGEPWFITIDIKNLAQQIPCIENKRKCVLVKTTDEQYPTIKLFFANDDDYNALIDSVKNHERAANFNKEQKKREQEKRNPQIKQLEQETEKQKLQVKQLEKEIEKLIKEQVLIKEKRKAAKEQATQLQRQKVWLDSLLSATKNLKNQCIDTPSGNTKQSFTFDANAAENYYISIADEHLIGHIDDYDFVIAVQEIPRTKSDRELFLSNNQIRIDPETITEVVNVKPESPKEIDVKRVDKDETITLFFDNEDDYTSFFKLIKSKLDKINEKLIKDSVHTEIEIIHEEHKLRNEQANNLFYKRLTLGVAAAFGLGLGGYFIYKTKPTWFANGFMKLFGFKR